ncbi:YjjG family noncanonical pyrimidine nucleotidase [Solitalea sp. MAHUQ-68]|uniref:YjjG family noncanonical pyrimidine nucleotidase n=1 Tax=Solitalea agri TaxID=2953739 RepID=A0A9X2F2T5_9SPHI|nr:YjjG family noncanonical pyrimidine nucleotidase [Solitalea agri]MCO4293090.1 YjjG family noncanonical pyrimidine nucleotidase [Solitalea agri]
MKTYHHLFFDLDHTIWDFDKNAEETLRELFDTYKLSVLGLKSVDLFIDVYTENNHALWAQYHKGVISKAQLRHERFRKTFRDLNVDDHLVPASFETDYVRICPTKTNLFPHAHETLAYLQSKYKLHLISNGFYESTLIKVETTGIGKYFDHINISEKIGVNKPDPEIFHHAMSLAQASVYESIMIGDSLEADIAGAQAVDMDCIFFNPRNIVHNIKVDHEIKSLDELQQIL